MIRRLVSFAAASCIAAPAAAQDLDINLNGQTVELGVSKQVHGPGALNSGAVDVSGLFTSKNDYLAGIGARVMGQAGSGSPGLEVGVGAKLFGGSVDSNGVAALTLNGAVRYSPPPLPRLAVGVNVYYAPSIVTFADANYYFQGEVRVAYEILPRSYVYVGYRDLRVGITGPGDKTVDSNVLVGIKLHF